MGAIDSTYPKQLGFKKDLKPFKLLTLQCVSWVLLLMIVKAMVSASREVFIRLKCEYRVA
jgi:hypothetical protein